VDEAFDAMEMEGNLQKRSAKQREAAIEYIKKGFSPEKVKEALQSDDFELALAALEGASKGVGGGGGRDDLLDRIAKVDGLLRTAQDANPDGGATVDAYASMRDALMKQWQAQQLGIDAPAGAAAGGAAVPGAATTEPKVAAPTLPPAPPATAEEEAALKEQQKRGVTQEQRQQLADAAWTGLKGVTAARGADAAGTPDVISEARKAIVGGETTNKRAQRIAALARAYADGRNVKVGTAVAGGLASGFSEEIDTFATPAEALVRELGYEPDAIVGQAPSSPGGPLRDVTALEAANAILADTAVPFLELKKGVEVATGDSEEDPLIEAALEKARTGKLKKD
jgi:hypothetical protein